MGFYSCLFPVCPQTQKSTLMQTLYTVSNYNFESVSAWMKQFKYLTSANPLKKERLWKARTEFLQAHVGVSWANKVGTCREIEEIEERTGGKKL